MNLKIISGIIYTFLLFFIINFPSFPQFFTRVLDAGPIVTDSVKSAGGSWTDINNDGFPDVYTGGDSSFIYLNNGNGTFTGVTSSPPLMTSVIAVLGVFADYNNDGYNDLYQTNYIDLATNSPASNFLYKNSGPPDFSFTKVSITEDSTYCSTASWIDYDKDGDLDIFAFGGLNTPDLFYRNNGDGTFTRESDFPFLRSRPSGSAQDIWIDYDDDGDLDLFIVNHSAKNELFKSFAVETANPDSFVTITNTGLTDDNTEFDIGASWGDYDNDGDFDVIVAYTNGASDRLYQNNGDGTFTRILTGPVVQNNTSTSFIIWGDHDNDGDLDLFKATVGFNPTLSAFYRNDGSGVFTQLTSTEMGDLIALLPAPQSGFWADYDNDGDLDMYINNYAVPNMTTGSPRPNYLLRNNMGNLNKWINIKCVGTTSNRSAIGTKITIKANIGGDQVSQIRYVNGGTASFHYQGELRQHFGLGNALTIDSIIIEWTNGLQEVYTDVQTNKFYVATEGTGLSVGIENLGTEIPSGYNLKQNYPNPFNPVTNIQFEIPKQSLVKLAVYDLLGREVKSLVNQELKAGNYNVNLSGSDLTSGIYFYTLNAGDFSETKRMVLIK